MPSINSQSLFNTVTSELTLRKMQDINPNKFTSSVLQMSDQQSRDKNYEKSLEWLRTYVTSLQAKLNSAIEELNSIYETMMTETLYRRADTKDTAKLLNPLAMVNSSACPAAGSANALDITPYSNNIYNNQYNPLFGSRALDLENYYNLSINQDKSIARSYYENAGNTHHEFGASAFGTLQYLWMWDLDRINASYATTKDSYFKDGVLYVAPGDPRLLTGIASVDPNLTLVGGSANSLQINETALQPNRKVFLPEEEKDVSRETNLLRVTVEEKNPLAGWIRNYDHSGSSQRGGGGVLPQDRKSVV